jgi:Tol biopolymer transport system component
VRDEERVETGWEIFVMDADGSNQVNLTNNPDFAAAPEWSPDGKQIAFESDRDFDIDPTEFTFEILVMQADGTGIFNITNHDADDEFPSWSPDGSRIAFQTNRIGGLEIFLMDPSGENLVNLTNHPAADFGAAWSPDGNRIAFSSSRYGGQRREDLLVMAPDGTGLIRLTPGDGSARFATWRP